MASGYALPAANRLYPHHGHSHSFGGSATSTHVMLENGSLQIPQRDIASHNSLRSSKHARSLSSWSPVRNTRPRGESDLGRPSVSVYRPTLARLDSEVPPRTLSKFSISEAITALLIPTPFLLASAAYSVITHEELSGGSHPLPPYARLQHGANGRTVKLPRQRFSTDSGLIEACSLTSGTLLLVGIVALIRTRSLLAARGSNNPSETSPFNAKSARSIAVRILPLWLSFFAAVQIGGLRTGLVLLVATSAGLVGVSSFNDAKRLIFSRPASTATLGLAVVLDLSGVTFHAPTSHLAVGYLALILSFYRTPLPIYAGQEESAASPLTSNRHEIHLTLLSGILLSLVTMASLLWSSVAPHFQGYTLLFGALSVAAMSITILYAQPQSLRRSPPAGLGLGCFGMACCAYAFSPSTWGSMCNVGLAALSFAGAKFDMRTRSKHSQTIQQNSGFTTFLLDKCEPGSLWYGILADKDSRRITYYTTLNFVFMFVQAVYGYLSGSLGLLSDTVHMFFDCLGLVVGLMAAVVSKRPPTPEKPYGWSKLNTLAGFGNGVFLVLVSIEFVWEAIEGIMGQKELRHVRELLVVSVAGLLVNMVGMFAFGHAHAHGHDHGHEHGHGHNHNHDHHHHHHHHHNNNNNNNGHGHDHTLGHDHHHHDHHHHHDSHEHHNENMHGIYLHVAADAGGSLAVIVSTALTLWRPWYLWDPLATICIAVLIVAAAIPLVMSSGRKLLLVVPDKKEWGIKNTLQDLGDLRGVVGYSNPRFWEDEESGQLKGTINVIAAPQADVEDVRGRVDDLMQERGLDLVIQVGSEPV
ncbi:cation efflux protein [Piedraia hortae CBS 480.64]|uniref:Zinc transporter n=1 Tax=Piedraia hortae CBS 480.64 TaxID=1314780 RepID=A0A6A7BSA8_9PEZI|nr:cation efflux protein [Piedraia hortae CBS 480.64]